MLTTINAQADPLAPSASEIDDKASAALSRLYSQNAGARALGAKAKDVLVFPDMRSISQSVFLQPHRGWRKRIGVNNPSGAGRRSRCTAKFRIHRLGAGLSRNVAFFDACVSALFCRIEAINVHPVSERDIRPQLGAVILLAQWDQ